MIREIITKLKCERGIFGLFKKTPKPNLTPDIPMPSQESLYFTKPLRELAETGINAARTGAETPGIGFGQDFLNRATNPAIKEIQRTFTEDTLPQLSSQQSARGIARSSLATDQIAREQRVAQGNINQLLANFYVLNEQQKKSDIGTRLNLATGLQDQQAAMKSAEASASERLANATAAQQTSRAAAESERLTKLGNIAIGAVAGGVGGFGASGMSGAFTGMASGAMNPASLGKISSISTATLGNTSNDDLVKALLQALGQ